MNLLHLFDKTEEKLKQIDEQLKGVTRPPIPKEDIGLTRVTCIAYEALKDEKEYLLDILALLFKELER